MKFFHRTTEDNWKKIQQEGILFGVPANPTSRHTCLAPDDWGESYGNVLLEVDYEPKGVGSGVDNYGFNPPAGMICTHFAVFVPIPIDLCRTLKPERSDDKA